MSTQKRGFGQKGETGVYPNDLFGGKKGRRRGERGTKGRKESAKNFLFGTNS